MNNKIAFPANSRPSIDQKSLDSKQGSLGRYNLKLLDPLNRTFEQLTAKSLFHKQSCELSNVWANLKIYKNAKHIIFLQSVRLNSANSNNSLSPSNQVHHLKINNALTRLGVTQLPEPIAELTQLQSSIDLWKRYQPIEVEQRGTLLKQLVDEIAERIENYHTKKAFIEAFNQNTSSIK